MSKKIGHVVYQTHWDNEWYFTDRESQVQLVYHMREMLTMLEQGAVERFLLDGQTAIVEDYLSVCPEDKIRIEKLIGNGRLLIGPWHAQTETFAVSGESMVNNLRLGIDYANSLGGASMVSYLPDSFGHPVDFPQIFNGVGIDKFCFRRGMGDKHQLPTEFYWEGDNNSRVLTNVLIDGYGWSYDPFFSGTLLDKGLVSECKTNELTPLQLIAEKAACDEFLMTMGNDQTPIRPDFKEKLEYYNSTSDEYLFKETSFEDYFKRLEEVCGETLPTYRGEFLDTQYSRIHKSINSVRYDIKQLQDKIERLMTYNLQPLMAMLDKLGVPWESGLVDEIWRLLARSQTHSVCTCTDKTNARIFERLKMSYELAESTHAYLLRKIALTVDIEEGRTPLVVTNTLPESRKVVARYRVFTPEEDFSLWLNGKEIVHSVINNEYTYGGTYHKDVSLHDKNKYFYFSEVEVELVLPAMSYQVIEVDPVVSPKCKAAKQSINGTRIENNELALSFDEGILNLTVNSLGKKFNNVVCFQNDGDAGDNYDHCPPEHDWLLDLDLSDTKVEVTKHIHSSEMRLSGTWSVPASLESRENKTCDAKLEYVIKFTLNDQSKLIDISIKIDNTAFNTRMRMIVNSEISSQFSFAGTQYTEIARETNPEELEYWREKGFVEEPTTTEPLLNYVSLKGDDYHTTILSHGCKEYQIAGDEFNQLAITLYRTCGHFGLPDLSRRPGRASGLAEQLIETPDSQLQKTLEFDLAMKFDKEHDINQVRKDYVEFATLNGYYHEQDLSRTGELSISYFHTNPLPFSLPKQYSMLDLGNTGLVFSTLSKGRGNEYLLRVYNPGNETVELGNIQGTEVLGSSNLLGDGIVSLESTINPGQILTIVIT
ncbi:glycoside hydrolase family 38 C-terminal domain-containing protein [Psychromonas ossibalaenae]|uniref:glycoside hydrolase family 38 N-terminal domain-containing protein n=1 Tax=Psychromonas ossibalaenae TaxID=444922 RepID=UPI000365FF04|nr:glycoside hydrolase family 38 C-terminal domain-containing protein [Psychromonas ossibalaenae]